MRYGLKQLVCEVKKPSPIDREDALQDITLETPKAEGCDLLVKVIALSPISPKVRSQIND